MDEVLSLCGCKTVAELAQKQKDISIEKPKEEEKEEKLIYLIPLSQSKQPKEQLVRNEVFKSARVGLYLTKSVGYDLQEKFIFKNYRFFLKPKCMEKGKHYIIISLFLQGKTVFQISTLLNSSNSTVKKYLELFESGKEKKLFLFFYFFIYFYLFLFLFIFIFIYLFYLYFCFFCRKK